MQGERGEGIEVCVGVCMHVSAGMFCEYQYLLHDTRTYAAGVVASHLYLHGLRGLNEAIAS